MSRRSHGMVAAALMVVAVFVPTVVSAATCWAPPVAAPVTDPFRLPPCRWCAGNRGIEYATTPGEPVRAVESGRVSFAGTVAGSRYVVVEHRDGRRATYGRLLVGHTDAGELVLRGQIVGRAGATFHFGLRDGDRYVDPGPSIGELVGRPRLVPADGGPAAPPPAPRLRCAARVMSR